MRRLLAKIRARCIGSGVEAKEPPGRLSNGPVEFDAKPRLEKVELRRQLLQTRNTLSQASVASRSETICRRLSEHEALEGHGAVALFWPIESRREVDLRSLDEWLRAQQRRVCYPFWDRLGDGTSLLGFRYVNGVSELAERGHRFLEPAPQAPVVTRGDVDAVIVPALAVTRGGERLGYGSGFYDVALPALCPPAKSVVVAFDFQCLSALPTEPHDVRCDFVVTDG